ncbi:MAG TPA: S8 family serine peptidase [Candidatus Eisenbacteria bacterium]|nr:S8 family serine peptidase [Candidatus Eisenbacteria bacterium]
MLHLHTKLCEKSALYRRWHDHPSHPFVHWALFLLAVSFMTYAYVSDVNTGLTEEDEQPLTGHMTAGRVVGEAKEHVLVKFKPQANLSRRDEVLAGLGMQKLSTIDGLDVQLVSVPPGQTPEQAVGRLRNEVDVQFAEPDEVFEPSLVPNDPWYANWQNDKRQINAPAAWDVTTGSAAQIIAIADTGVDCAHEDLAANCVAGWNFYDNNGDTQDVYGHGTSVAGVAAAVGNNGVGMAGNVWAAKIMPLRVSAPDGTASTSTIATAVTYAADHGAKVVNNSYQTGGSATVRSAAQYLKGKGGLLVVSEGNYGTSTGYTNSPDIISVSGVDANDALYSWSSFGNDVDVAAPGCTGAATKNQGGYGSFCGTSNAAPETSGLLMLVWAANPGLTPDQVQQVLFDSAKALGPSGWDDHYGWGRIDAAAAVALATQSGGTTTPPPPPPPPAPASISITSFTVTNKTAAAAVVSWTTNLPSTGVVRYGTTTDLGQTLNDPNQGTNHSVTLSGLQKSTKYYYVISAQALDGTSSANTAVQNFRTKSR